MNPVELLAPPSPLGAPAPYGFLVFFKVLGFTLHLVPMNLWYAGLFVALSLHARGQGPARRWAERLLQQMPLYIALGINFGIVPLLFLQVSYYRVFYPATILAAWPWFAIIPFLGVAYYGVYAYVVGSKSGRPLVPWQRAGGWAAALLFLAIGFLFAHGMSLMTRPDAWPALWQRTGVAGGVLGTALHASDPTLWPRWLLVFGLALGTTAVHVVVDAALLARDADEGYRRWAGRFAVRLYLAGTIVFAAMGAWYVFGTWAPELRSRMLAGPALALTAAAALSPGLVWLLLLAQRRGVTRPLAWATAAAQLGVLALNAIARQVVQNLELAPWFDPASEPVRTQWSPLVAFLLVLAAGVVALGWIAGAFLRAGRAPERA